MSIAYCFAGWAATVVIAVAVLPQVKELARRLGNPGAWPLPAVLGALGLLILLAASWPRQPERGR